MKAILFIIFLIPMAAFSQDTLLYKVFPLNENKVTYEKVLTIDSVPKENLFTKLKEWAVDHYKSQKTTLESEDKGAGFLVYKGYFTVIKRYSGGILKGKPFIIDVYHTIKFYVKESKVKIVITDLETVSHDFASNYISDRNLTPIDHVHVERWGADIDERRKTASQKKIDRWDNELTESAKAVDAGINEMFASIDGALRKKSAFDF